MSQSRRGISLSSARVILVAFTAFFLLCGCHSVPKSAGSGEITPEQRELNMESFEYIWNTIDEKFWDPDIMGLDWEKLGIKYRERVRNAGNMGQAREAMNAMLGELGQSHFAVIPREAYQNLAGSERKGSSAGDVGITSRIRQEKPIVVSVRKGSSAAEAGVEPGWEIASINGEITADKLSDIKEGLSEEPFLKFSLNASLLHMLSGPPGDTLTVRFIDSAGNEAIRDLTLESRKGTAHKFGYLPEFHVWLDSMEIGNNIGYIRFSSFFDPMKIMPEFNKAMLDYLDKDGIIIDIRGNPGGIGAMAMGMAGWFVEERGRYLGKLTTRDSELKLIINPRPNTFSGKVAVLVDEMSTSSSEFLAGGLQAIGAARIFGTRTPGAALPSVIDKLPNGDAFQYVIGNYTAEDGTRLEGNGVVPDVEITPGRAQLLREDNPVLNAAADWINGSAR